MYCDFHDLHGGVEHACMAIDMLQQRSIAHIVQQRQRHNTRKPTDDPDSRESRFLLYKAIVAWHWANPLGAEVRVRIPLCVLRAVRRMFPNPCCI